MTNNTIDLGWATAKIGLGFGLTISSPDDAVQPAQSIYISPSNAVKLAKFIMEQYGVKDE